MFGIAPFGSSPFGAEGPYVPPPIIYPEPRDFTDGVISMWQIDLAPLGGPIFYFHSMATEGSLVHWGGIEYTPLPIEIDGIETNARGALPQPNVTISNLYGAANLLVDEFGGLIGAYVTRYRTLARFLDGGSDPDPNAYLSKDVFVVAQKVSHNALAIVFKLSTTIDQPNSKIPRRLVLRTPCSHIYRYFNPATGAFDYSRATCPYTGSNYWDENDLPTAQSLDQCSRMLTGCQLRFPGQGLPGRFFPGVGRIK